MHNFWVTRKILITKKLLPAHDGYLFSLSLPVLYGGSNTPYINTSLVLKMTHFLNDTSN